MSYMNTLITVAQEQTYLQQ